MNRNRARLDRLRKTGPIEITVTAEDRSNQDDSHHSERRLDMHHTVGEVMTTDVITIDSTASLQEAKALMEEHRVRRLPVVDEDGDLVGILSWGDVRESTSVEAVKMSSPYAPDADEEWLTVWEAMTRDPVVVTSETNLADAVELMLNHKIGGLPVVAKTTGKGRRHLIGIVTETDIFQLMLRIWRKEEAG